MARIGLRPLETRFGRRMLGLFVLCSLLPIIALGVATYLRVAGSLRAQAEERLRLTGRRMGAALFDRLVALDASLALAAAGSPRTTPDSATLGLFEAVTVERPETGTRAHWGPVLAASPLTARQLDHLGAGGTVLIVTSDPDPAVIMTRPLDRDRPADGVVRARINPEAIGRAVWSEAEEFGAVAPCIVAATDRQVVFCPAHVAPFAAGVFDPALGDTASGTFAWSDDEGRYLAGYWSLFLAFRFASPDWRVIHSETEASIFAPLAPFRRAFPLAAVLAVLVVALLATTQIRRGLQPLAALQAATHRVGRQEFEEPVRIHSGDEFETLAGAFNDMSTRLRERFAEAEQLNAALRETTEDVREREARLRAVLESAADAIITVDADGLIESFNSAAEDMFGRGRAAVAGRSVSDLFTVPLGTGPGHLPPVAVVGSAVMQVAGRRADGSTFPAEATATRVVLPGPEHFTLFVRDMTDERRAAEEHERLEAELRHAQKLETMGTLAGGIAHDFNNILTPIIGHVDLALDEVPPGTPLQEDLREVRAAAGRAKDLVQQILLFARRDKPAFGALELEPLVKETLKLVRASLPATIEIRVGVDKDVPPIMGDPGQIHQVLMNLCTNAYHAMRERGTGTLTIGLDVVPVPPAVSVAADRFDIDHAVRLTVRDTGVGMDAATRDRLFEPFFTTKDAGEGTGLGMSIVHGIVTNHGGAIDLETAPGRGTAFHLYFPPGSATEPVETVTAEATELQRGEGHILVVDDDEVVARLADRALKRLGYGVTYFTAPDDALAWLTGPDGTCDLLLTDQTMPGMTGLQLAERSHGARPDLPVIIMSGYAELGAETDLAPLGVREVLLKPIELASLARAVSRALRAPEGANES